MADCPHGMPTAGSCIDCMNDGGLPARKIVRDGWPFTAKLDGACGGCDQGTHPGQRIVRMSDGTYRHLGQREKMRRG